MAWAVPITLLSMSLIATSGDGRPGIQAAALRDPKPAEVDAIFKEFDRPGSPGCSIAVEHKGKILFAKGYGLANLEYCVANTQETVFHVASVSKQVTAFAIQLLVEDGRVNLEDDVRKYVPELPDYGKVITLANLMHHTSGIRDQWDLLGMGAWRMDDVIVEGDLLRAIFRQKSLNFDPGKRFLYSNSGYTLLGLVVQRVTGHSLRKFCDDRLFAPLGMSQTHFHDDYKEVVANRAVSYYPRESGGFENSVLTFGNVGATGLFTTASDFVRWTRNLVSPTVGSRALSVRMGETLTFADGRPNRYASGLLTGQYRGLRVLEHLGSDAGFRSDCFVFPDQEFSIVLFSNLGTTEPATLARSVADLYMADLLAPAPKPPAPAPVDLNSAKEIEGVYEFDPGLVVGFAVREGKLRARIGAGEAVEPIEVGPGEVRVPGVGTCHFTKRGRSVECILTNSDVVEVARKLKLYDSKSELGELAGEFYSEEAAGFARLSVESGKLHLDLTKWDDDLVPLARDVFAVGSKIVRFERSRSGRVAGLTLSTPRCFGVRFKRMG